MAVDITGAVIGPIFILVTIGIFIAMGFYAIKNLRGFKGGLMSKGWSYISIAVFFFIAGQLFLISGGGQAIAGLKLLASYNIGLGSIMETIGGLLLVLGFRAQNNIWKMNKTSAKVSGSTESKVK